MLLGAAGALRRNEGGCAWLDRALALPPVPGTSARERRALGSMAACFACLAAAFALGVDLSAAPTGAEAKPLQRELVSADPDAEEAVAMTQSWRLAGDERDVLGRLTRESPHASLSVSWTAEKGEGSVYLVLYREPSGRVFAFEADLESETVLPTPEAVELLTAMRVREHSPRHVELYAAR